LDLRLIFDRFMLMTCGSYIGSHLARACHTPMPFSLFNSAVTFDTMTQPTRRQAAISKCENHDIEEGETRRRPRKRIVKKRRLKEDPYRRLKRALLNIPAEGLMSILWVSIFILALIKSRYVRRSRASIQPGIPDIFAGGFTSMSLDATSSCDDPLTIKDIDFTLVIQCSEDRLWMMKYHCDRWTNHISLAVLSNRTNEYVFDGLVDNGCDPDLLHIEVLNSTFYAYDDYPVIFCEIWLFGTSEHPTQCLLTSIFGKISTYIRHCSRQGSTWSKTPDLHSLFLPFN